MSDYPDIASPEFKKNPYPYYARLRAESPVAQIELKGQRYWLLTRYADVAAALKDDRFRKNAYQTLSPEAIRKKLPWIPKFLQPLRTNMLDVDPPDHTRLRALVSKAFTPRFVEQLRARIEAQAAELVDRIRRRGQAELIGDFALPIPLNVIADMLGVPERERLAFRSWSDKMVSVTTGLEALTALPAMWRFLRYVRGLARRARGSTAEDMIAALVRVEEAGDRLSEDELAAMVFLLLVAGYETTVNLIGTGTLTLLQHPEQLERLRADPELIKPAVEELLRFCSPVDMATVRFTSEDATYGGVTIPKGEVVGAVIGSANRDEEHFKDPDRLDLGRDPNRHLAFGHGIHYCLGAPLARLEAQIALTALFDRGTHLKLATPAESLRWRRSPILRGLKALPLRVGRA
jgi:cytochrome P450 PksS